MVVRIEVERDDAVLRRILSLRRGNGNIYISTPQTQDPAKNGIIALHLDANHHADQIQHFGPIDGGTGIRFHNDRLYASTPSGVSRSHVPRQRTRVRRTRPTPVCRARRVREPVYCADASPSRAALAYDAARRFEAVSGSRDARGRVALRRQ